MLPRPIVVALSVLGCGGSSGDPFSVCNTSPETCTPIVDSISPTRGPLAGGIPVTIAGRGFRPARAGDAVEVHFGAQKAEITEASDTRLVAIAPAAAAWGRVDVVVRNASGSSKLSSPGEAFTYAVYQRLNGPPAASIGTVASADAGRGVVAVTTGPSQLWVRRPPADWVHKDLGGFAVTAVASAPANPDVFYAATRGGLYKSTDAAQTWARLETSPTDANELLVHPTDPSIVFAYSPGLSRTEDGGSTWQSSGVSGIGVWAVAMAPSQPSVMLAGSGNFMDKSTDGGGTWTQAMNGLFGAGYVAIGFDPLDPNVAYAASPHNLFKTIDGAASWTLAYDFPGEGSDAVVALASPAGRVLASLAQGTYAVGAGLADWTRRTEPTTAMITDASRSRVLAGTDGHGLISSDDGGDAWAFHSSPPTAVITSALVDAANPSVVHLGTRGGMFRTTEARGAALFTSVAGAPSDRITDLTVDPNNSAHLYAISKGVSSRAWRSSDAGSSWAEMTSLAGSNVEKIAVAPGGTVLYAFGRDSGGAAIFKSTDGGATFVANRTGLPTGSSSTAHGIQIAPSDTNRIYFAFGARLYTSGDAGATWTGSSGLLSSNIDGFAVDPTNAASVIVLQYGRNFQRSTNFGASWTTFGTYLGRPLNDVDRFIIAGDTFFAGSPLGQIYRSIDKGATFVRITHDYPGAVQGFVLIPGAKPLLWVAAEAGGLFTVDANVPSMQ